MDSNDLLGLHARGEAVHADETPAKGLGIADLDLDYFGRFFEQVYGQTLDEQPLPLPQLLENMNLMRAGELNLSAALLFAKAPQFRLPLFTVKAIAYPGVVPDEHNHIDSPFATRVLPYRGLGNGVLRAVRLYPRIEFENDRDGNQFRVTIPRPAPPS